RSQTCALWKYLPAHGGEYFPLRPLLSGKSLASHECGLPPGQVFLPSRWHLLRTTVLRRARRFHWLAAYCFQRSLPLGSFLVPASKISAIDDWQIGKIVMASHLG